MASSARVVAGPCVPRISVPKFVNRCGWSAPQSGPLSLSCHRSDVRLQVLRSLVPIASGPARLPKPVSVMSRLQAMESDAHLTEPSRTDHGSDFVYRGGPWVRKLLTRGGDALARHAGQDAVVFPGRHHWAPCIVSDPVPPAPMICRETLTHASAPSGTSIWCSSSAVQSRASVGVLAAIVACNAASLLAVTAAMALSNKYRAPPERRSASKRRSVQFTSSIQRGLVALFGKPRAHAWIGSSRGRLRADAFGIHRADLAPRVAAAQNSRQCSVTTVAATEHCGRRAARPCTSMIAKRRRP
jgi:hypothetical protein